MSLLCIEHHLLICPLSELMRVWIIHLGWCAVRRSLLHLVLRITNGLLGVMLLIELHLGEIPCRRKSVHWHPHAIHPHTVHHIPLRLRVRIRLLVLLLLVQLVLRVG